MALTTMHSKWFVIFFVLSFAVAGASLTLFALSASATDRSVDLSVRCNGDWSGTLQWTLDGAPIGTVIVIDCPDITGNSNFKLNLAVPTSPVTGAQVHANDLFIDLVSPVTTGVTGAATAACVFSRSFDPENLKTIHSTYNCGNDGPRGEKLSNKIRIR